MWSDRFRRLVNWLKSDVRCGMKVSVRRKRIHRNLYGRCYRRDDFFEIQIDRSLDEELTIEVLLHEWAHARSWNLLYDSYSAEEFLLNCHDAAWGIAYAEVYRSYIEFLKQEEFIGAKTQEVN